MCITEYKCYNCPINPKGNRTMKNLTPTHRTLLAIIQDEAKGQSIGVNNPLVIDLIAAGKVVETAERVKTQDGGMVNVMFTVRVVG